MASQTLTIWTALVDAIKALNLVDDVRAYPAHKVANERFYEDIPDLADRAALVICRGWSDADGKRRRDWSLVLVIRDASGAGSDAAAAALDAAATQLADAALLGGAVWVLPTSRVLIADSSPTCAVCELLFQSLEVAA